MKTVWLEEVDSTNSYAKKLFENGEREDTCIIAERQTSGMGTKGRSFVSEKGGIYFTKLAFYDGLKSKDAFRIMSSSAVAVCKTLEKFGLTPKIKWANDVFVNGKKISGILISNAFSGDRVSRSIIGIGLNVNNTFVGELKDIATSMYEVIGEKFNIKDVAEELISQTSELHPFEDYKERMGFMGEEVTLCFSDKTITAKTVRVENTGELVVKTEDGEMKVNSAEVSLRLKN